MQRRAWLVTTLLFAAGCGGPAARGGKSSRKGGHSRSGEPRSVPPRKQPKGPRTMSNLLVDAYISDLGSPSPEKRIRAAEELANIGAEAKSALPLLDKLARDADAKVSAAAKRAIKAIRGR